VFGPDNQSKCFIVGLNSVHPWEERAIMTPVAVSRAGGKNKAGKMPKRSGSLVVLSENQKSFDFFEQPQLGELI
jgi:hypothetical protein